MTRPSLLMTEIKDSQGYDLHRTVVNPRSLGKDDDGDGTVTVPVPRPYYSREEETMFQGFCWLAVIGVSCILAVLLALTLVGGMVLVIYRIIESLIF